MSAEVFLFLRKQVESAAELQALPCDGVGLLQMEDVFEIDVPVHPMAVIRHRELEGTPAGRKLAEMTEHHDSPADYFIDTVAERLAWVAHQFAPRPVQVRFSDLTSAGYARLLGGERFENVEEYPLLGLRGATRYLSQHYREGFELECLALKRAREGGGADNLEAVIPFIRTVAEADALIDVIARIGLHRGLPGFRLHAMIELPGNLAVLEDFAERFDGLSIGSGDLAHLLFGVHPGPGLSSIDYDADIFRRVVADVIHVAGDFGVACNLCGPAAEHASLAAFAIAEGLGRLTVTPEAFGRVQWHESRTSPRDRSHERQELRSP